MMPTITPTQSNYPQIIDGFCYSGLFGMRPLTGLNWYWACLSNLEDLRLAADSYRPRHWTVPKNFFDPANTNSANVAAREDRFLRIPSETG